MELITTVTEMVTRQAQVPRPIGLVPTMGFLHDGHISLVRRALKENSTVVTSIFVNPTQFGPQEDLANYPRSTERDLEVLEKEGVNIVFMPSTREIYPVGFETSVDPGAIATPLEGKARPGHLIGVATIVTKLFTITQPNYAYFGQKDGQQARVIQHINTDLNLGVTVVVCPTVREPDGLAMSSRNSYLNNAERKSATILYRALRHAKELFTQGERNTSNIRTAMIKLIEAEPTAQIDYVSIANLETLSEIKRIDQPAMISLAVRIGEARLIDNLIISEISE
jgi:pantoate--beta-alanine ligase